MSVINQMLHDLENRRSQIASNNNFSYHDLSFIPTLSNRYNFETAIYVVLFGVILATVILLSIKLINGETIITQTDNNIVVQENIVPVKAVPVEPDTSVEPITSFKIETSSQQPIEYEVSTSVIRKQDKVLIKKLPAKQIIKTQQVIKTTPVIESTNEGVVHKRRRELSKPQQADKLYQSGYEYLLAKNNVKAQEELRNALMVMPAHNRSRELLAGIYIKTGRLVEARTLLQYGMRISPTHFIFAKLYARILMDQNDNVTAISVLLRNPPAQSVDPDYHALLAALYQKNKQHHKAATLYSQLLKQRASYGVWWLGMAISLEALGNASQAKSAYEKAKNSGNLTKGLYKYTDQRVAALAEIAYP